MNLTKDQWTLMLQVMGVTQAPDKLLSAGVTMMIGEYVHSTAAEQIDVLQTAKLCVDKLAAKLGPLSEQLAAEIAQLQEPQQ